MSFGSRQWDNPVNWSFRVGRLFGITIRLHLLFIIGAILILFWSAKDVDKQGGWSGVTDSLLTILLLFMIVLLHEFGHCWGARYTGGEADEILLWPLGGLAMVRPPHTPRAHFITTATGPTVNVILCAVTAALLVALHGGLGAVPWNPWQPFWPVDMSVDLADAVQKWLRIVFGLSYMLLLFNLLPIYPFDGGRLLHAYLWPRQGFHQATLTATFVGMVGAIVLGLIGMLTEAYIMVFIAFFGYITCHMDRQAAKMQMYEGLGEFGYDFSAGHTSFDETFAEPRSKRPGFFARRRLAREEARRKREAEAREKHRRRVDEILDKVHRHGMQSLTAEEMRVLHEETERQRSAGE